MRLSALEFCSEITAQIAAGIQPIKVICKIKQRIEVSILPLKKKETHGKNMAINVIINVGSGVLINHFNVPSASQSLGNDQPKYIKSQ